MTKAKAALVLALYNRLHATYGPQNWWPAETAFEMIVGAYLTQNTAWRNVELALINLRNADKLTPAGIRSLSIDELQQLIRPSGFFRQKASRLKIFIDLLDTGFAGDLNALLSLPPSELRTRLLALTGVGRETADSILLYAAHRPVFVIDLYTRRLLLHEQIYPDALELDYDVLRERIESAFSSQYPDDLARTTAFSEFHALIVTHGKRARAG